MSDNPPEDDDALREDESSDEVSKSDQLGSSWFDEETRLRDEANDSDITDLQPPGSELDPDFDVNFDPLDNLQPGDPPSRQFGKYKLIKKIGQGGMGVVYNALDTEMERFVALKLMRLERSESGQNADRQRFKQEAKTAGSLEHENIVTVHAIGEHNNCLYIDMALVDGDTLTSFVERQRANGTLTVQRIIGIAIQIARGLKAAHDRGIIHRDIKPGNILIDQYGQVKIVDFGLARKSNGPHITSRNVTLGTPNFMSPEQVKGLAELDDKSDLFSFGAVLFFLCSGRFPFHAEDQATILYRVAHEPHQPLQEVDAELPDALCRIVDELLVKDRKDRQITAATIAADLTKLLNQVETGQDVNLPEEMTKNSFPKPVVWGTGVAVIAVGVSFMFMQGLQSSTVDALPNVDGSLLTSDLDGEPRIAAAPDPMHVTAGQGGNVPSIAAALRYVSQGGTISIVGPVDDKTPINLKPEHLGVRITADNATDVPSLVIDSVTDVMIENLNISCRPDQHAIKVEGDCAGLGFRNVRVTQVSQKTKSTAAAIFLRDVKGTEQAPVTFERCQINCFKTGLTILANETNCRWIAIHECRFVGTRLDDGIHILLEGNVDKGTTIDLVTISHSLFARTGTGIRLSHAMGAEIEHNAFWDIFARCVNTQIDGPTERVIVRHNLALNGCPQFVLSALGPPNLECSGNLATQIHHETGVTYAELEVASEDPTHADFLQPNHFPDILREWQVDYVGARPLKNVYSESQQL